MHRFIHYIQFLGWLLITTCWGIGCKKTDSLEAPRIFKPGGVSVKTTATTATVSWSVPLLGAGQPLNYTVAFSNDSTFAATAFSLTTDSLTATVTDDKITLRKKYYVRVKANAYEEQPESKWTTPASFTVNGEQWFYPIREVELNETAVTLRWQLNAGLTKIVLTPKDGAPVSYALTTGELTNGYTSITGLTANVTYTAELFLGDKSKGILTFTTLTPTVYSVILNPGDNLVDAVNAAADNAVIGLNPGMYDAAGIAFSVIQKTVTIKSVSNNPANTKVYFKEFTLKGSGAGINLSGIEWDGASNTALYFINLTGVTKDAELANFTQVTISNCIVHDAATSFLRANRGSNAGDYKMNQITVRNSLVYNISTNLSYNCFHLDKLELTTMQVTNSTFYNVGQALVSSSTVLATMPAIAFDYCTINYLGGKAKYVLMDAGSNPVRFGITNSIVANTPLSGQTIATVAIRATGAGTALTFSNNNTFNLVADAAGTAITMPITNITQVGNNTINLGWSSATTNFTLPVGSVLRTVSSAGTAIGDPRWTY